MGLAAVPAKSSESSTANPQAECTDWVCFAACSSLIAGGLLLLGGQRRAAMVAALAGTALVLVDEREALRTFLERVPGYLDDAQWLIGQVEEVVDDLNAKGQSLREILTK
jgi:hypothetical protein